MQAGYVPERSLTTKEAAAVLGLSPVSVRSALDRGTMIGEKRGRDWLVPLSEVRNYEFLHLHGRKPRKG